MNMISVNHFRNDEISVIKALVLKTGLIKSLIVIERFFAITLRDLEFSSLFSNKLKGFVGWLGFLNVLGYFQDRGAEFWVDYIDPIAGSLIELDLSKAMQLQIYFEWDARICEHDHIFKHAIRTGFFIDVGAHIGSISIPIAYMSPRTEVIAVEPLHSNFLQLARNIERNSLQNVTALEKAVSEANVSLAKFYVNFLQDGGGGLNNIHGHGTSGVFVSAEELSNLDNCIEVETVQLSSLINGKPCALKIDAEGYDHIILNEIIDCIDQRLVKFIAIEISEDNAEHIYCTLRSRYKYVYCRDRNSRKLVDIRELNDDWRRDALDLHCWND